MPAVKYDVFISYGDTDRAWVEGYLLDALKEADVSYHTEAAFALGTVRVLEFERSIKQSKHTLLVLSPGYFADGFNEFLDVLTQSYGLDTATWPVIPLILQPVELPPRLGMLVKLYATNAEEQEEAIRRLCADLKHSVPTSASKPTCPYPGMLPFSEDMSDRFFGRDREINELIERLHLHPLIAVVGPSGSGKSSLVLAGVLPQIRQSGLFGSGEWVMRIVRPTQTPMLNLATALGGDATNPDLAVKEMLRSLPNAQRLLLVVDQFEEVFTIAREQALHFGQTLLRVAEVANCYVILTIRADFYPELMNSPLWRKIKFHRLEVVPLDALGLHEAITRPAEDVGVFIEPALVERLIVDGANEPGVLPLIQETLVLLWEKVERRFLPLRAYETLMLPRKAYGGLNSYKLTGLQIAIARRADAAVADLTEEQQIIARRIFLRLIQFGEGRADTRRQQSIASLQVIGENPLLFEQTLNHLVNRRLLTLGGDERGEYRLVDIAHEALISAWNTLKEWILQRREAEQTRRQLAAKTENWIRLGRSNRGLLDEIELADANRWINSVDAADLGIEEGLLELIKLSKQSLEEAKQRELELVKAREQAQQRELEIVKAREKAQQRELQLISEKLEQETKAREQEAKARKQEVRARRAAQIRNRVAFISAIVLAGLTIFSFNKQREAEKQSVFALTQASEALLRFEYRRLDALTSAVEAAKKFKQAQLKDSALKHIVVGTLQQAVYGTGGSQTLSEINILSGHGGDVNSVSFSPTEDLLVSASSEDNTIKLWSSDGRELKTLKGHQQAVNSVSFSPDGKLIASASADKTIKIWSSDGQELKTLEGHQGAVNSVSFSSDGKLIASASADKTIKIWSSDGQELKTLEGHQGAVNSVSFSSNGELIASTSEDGKIILWDKQGEILKTLTAKSRNPANIAATSVIFNPDNKTFISASWGTIQLWSIDGRELQEINAHNDRIMGFSFSSNGKMVASASGDNTIKLWRFDDKTLQRFFGHKDYVYDARFSPNGKVIASASGDKTIKIWDLEGGELKTFEGHDGEVYSVNFSPDSTMIASGSEDETIKIWSLDEGELKTFKGHKDEVYSVSFSPDGKLIASGSKDKTIKIWSLDGRELKTFKGHDGEVYSVSFSPDGKMIASGSKDNTVGLWSLNGQEPKIFKGHENEVNSVSFSPDGRIIASASDDSTIRLWNLDNQQHKVFRGHRAGVMSAKFHPNGNVLASASWDFSIKLWNMDGQELKTFRGHGYQSDTAAINSISFSDDGTKLVSAGADKQVILWKLDLDNLLEHGCTWLQDYLKNNSSNQNKRNLCDDI